MTSLAPKPKVMRTLRPTSRRIALFGATTFVFAREGQRAVPTGPAPPPLPLAPQHAASSLRFDYFSLVNPYDPYFTGSIGTRVIL
ncbi:hypothetical protein DFH08DRAFT_964219 [Mycena albidolilacea]|uniref:Uncharacterized protein n=1 Tax=Mycena albidolilacea TaxID=1033008 RepID=A0AAD6ZTQ0_9AGAR|nr:hypothetical protein DFH08DRAFT_964219 [Mycena albidolilacea]